MPQALPAIGAFVAKVFTAKAIFVLARTLLVQAALAAVSRALTDKPRLGQHDLAQTIMVRSGTAPREIVYGQVRKSGVVIYQTTTGANNKYMWFALAIAGSQLQEMTDVWFDTELIANADINPTTGVITGSSKFAGKALILKKLGTSAQTVLSQLDSESSGWNVNHRGEGIAALFIRLERDAEVFPNGPPNEFFVLCKGKRIYDPRKDSTNGGTGLHRLGDATTWEWSDNEPLCRADYLRGGSLYFDTATPDKRLGMKVSDTLIDWPTLAASANEADEDVSLPGATTQKRYTANLVLSAGDSHESNVSKLAACSAMTSLPPMVGGKYRILVGRADAATHTLTDDDLFGGWELLGNEGLRGSANAIAGVYFDAARGWEEVTSQVRTDAAYESEDGGQILKNIPLEGVTNEHRAQRLAEIEKRRSRDQATVRFSCGASVYPIAPWEMFNVSLQEMPSWMAGKTWRAIAIELDLSLPPKVLITGRVESASVYTDLNPATDFITPNAGASQPINEKPDAIESIGGVGFADRVVVTWPFPSPWFPQWRIQVFEHTAATPFSSATKVWEGISNRAEVARTTTGDRYYWVRIKGLRGEFSDPTPLTSGHPLAPTSITAGFHITLDRNYHNKFLVGTGSGTTNQTTTVTPVNANGAVSYAWSRILGSTKITAINATGQTTGFQVPAGTPLADLEVVTATFEVVATDATPNTNSETVQVRFERNDSLQL